MNIRKDAIYKLKSFFHTHTDLLEKFLGQLLTVFNKLMLDEEFIIRETALIFYKNVFVKVENQYFQPFMEITLAYVCSALSHIREDIRLDSLEFLIFWIDKNVEGVRIGAEKIVKPFLCLLANPSMKKGDCSNSITTKKGVSQSRKSKVLAYFAKFIIKVFGTKKAIVDYDQSKFLLKYPIVFDDSLNLFEKEVEKKDYFQELFKTSFPLLLNCWIENESVLSEMALEWGPELESLCLVLDVLSVLFRIISNETRPEYFSYVQQIVKRIGNSFPFGLTSHTSASKKLDKLNLEYIEIVSYFFDTKTNISVQELNDFIVSKFDSHDISFENAQLIQIYLNNSLGLASCWFDSLLTSVIECNCAKGTNRHVQEMTSSFLSSVVNIVGTQKKLDYCIPMLEKWLEIISKSSHALDGKLKETVFEMLRNVMRTNGFGGKINFSILNPLKEFKDLDSMADLKEEINQYLFE